MTLIAVGQGLRKRANAGFSANAQLENRENAAADQIEAAEMQQQSQLYGTASGIGASYGLQKSLQAGKAASDSISTLNSMPGVAESGEFVTKGGELIFNPASGNAAVSGAEGVAAVSETLATNAALEGGAVAAAETGSAVAATEAAAAAAGTTAGSTGTMATLSTIAAPIAIGLGAAFLISKLFD